MAALILQQDNFAKDQWWPIILAACTLDTTVCHGDSTVTPFEQMTDIRPDFLHATKFYPGQLAICPRVGGIRLLQTNFQLCVVVCPVLSASDTITTTASSDTITTTASRTTISRPYSATGSKASANLRRERPTRRFL
jgi:hypothetical protein